VSSILEADTLLALDIGTVNTRASLFDVVDGRYRLVATGRASSTSGPPLFDLREGIHMAVEQVMAITGRPLLDEEENLILPATAEGAGVDIFVATSSAGPTVRAVLVGLMPGVSLESARRLAGSTYLQVLDEISLMDRRKEEEQIDLILRARPDLLLMVGGTDGGATTSVLRMVEMVRLAAGLFPDRERPQLVYAGNRTLAAEVMEQFENQQSVTLVPNIRPSLPEEDLAPARLRLSEAISELRARRIIGFEELKQWSGGYLMLTVDAFGRVVRYLSQVYDPDKGVLGVDLGASHTTLAAAFDGDLRLSVRTELGLGSVLPNLLNYCTPEDVLRWMPVEESPGSVLDYIYNKALYPASIPTELNELHLEYALARQILRSALTLAQPSWPEAVRHSTVLPAMEPIIASGAAMSRAPRPGYAALALLDALQPRGVSTLVLDPYSLVPALGAAAGPLPMVTVQVLESGSFISLGTVVSPVGRGRQGRPVLRVRLEPEGGGEPAEGQVRLGQLLRLPLRQGEHARLTLRPERGFDVGFGGPGRAGALRVAGGVLGIVIDARGRPLELSRDPGRRRELNQKWLYDIGALQ
jgi:hypothetical protein